MLDWDHTGKVSKKNWIIFMTIIKINSENKLIMDIMFYLYA